MMQHLNHYVECLICHKKFHSIQWHIKVHSVSAGEYREMFPGAVLQSELTRYRRSMTLMGHSTSVEARNKIGDANRGKVRTEEQKNEKSRANIRHYKEHPERREALSRIFTEMWQYPEYAEKVRTGVLRGLNSLSPGRKKKRNNGIGEAQTRAWANYTPEQRANRVRGWVEANQIFPTSIERTFMELCEEYDFPFRYCGNDKNMVVGGRIPDFVSTDELKSFIEIYGDYWHQGDDPQSRIDFFAEYGHSCIVVWEHEILNECEKVIERVRRFMNQ